MKNKATGLFQIIFTITDSSDSEMAEILHKEFKRMITRMINKIQEDMNKHLNEFKENNN
jgi:Txe/YoeB family toxin of Txe-Axe toxin-antitoxin module